MKKNALISVYDKTEIVKFALELIKLNFNLVSTGGTYKILKENNINVNSVEEITLFPEILNGRVKTLHPSIFAGILADKNDKNHIKELSGHQLKLFDLVVVDLYPFEETIKKDGVTLKEVIEKIDIGGVSLIRAAAKNYQSIHILINPNQYETYLMIYKKFNGNIPFEYSQILAQNAFDTITNYDFAIAKYFEEINKGINAEIKGSFRFSAEKFIRLSSRQELRYGENPDQKAAIFKQNFDEIFTVLHGKELSYNNLLDIDAAIGLINEFEAAEPTCAIIKHGNPCGVATSNNFLEAYLKAFETDKTSPFGGIIIINGNLDLNTSIELDKLFTEIIICTDFDDNVLQLLKKKKNRRLIKYSFYNEKDELKSISGGYLFQEKQVKLFDIGSLKNVTKKKPDKDQIDDMEFGVKVVKHTKSNAVVFVKDKRTLAIGGGQPSRVDSTRIAISRAKQYGLDLNGCVVASDAFFPFADSIEEIANSGCTAIVQPGGSVRDDEVIKAADENNIAMVFTGIRYFKH
ncbi:MAG TPA: bifunctional phosphoribosylaminoimidazolecarboxamide formyltransferase/IMP cyclohydrolase [Ignavibacteria bacterium]